MNKFLTFLILLMLSTNGYCIQAGTFTVNTPLATSSGGTGTANASNTAGGVVVPTGAANGANGVVVLNSSGNLITSGNVGVGSTTPGMALDVNGTVRSTGFMQIGTNPNTFGTNTINSSGINWQSVYYYGTSASAFTQSANLKIAFGTGLAYNGTVSNLPFTSSGSYVVTFAPVDISGYVTEFPSITQTSGSAFTIVGQTNITYNWMAIGY